jgi:hypothetical protein
MHDHCVHLKELLDVQATIIRRNIKDHKWFQRIADEQEAKDDFVKKFGGIMREVYCGHACVDRFDCEPAQQYLPGPEKK